MNIKVLKVIGAVVHGITLVGGLLLFAATVWIMAKPDAVMMRLEMDTVIAISAFMCAMSLLVVSLSALGLCGTLMSSHRMLKVFLTLLIIVFLIEVVGIVVPFAMRRRWEDKFNLQIFSIMDKYGLDEYPYVTKMWDDFQQNMKCCGSEKPEDWSFSAFVQQEYYPVLIPPSCCLSFNDAAGIKPRCFRRSDPSLYFNKGCLSVVKDLIWTYSGFIGGVVSAVFCFQVLLMALTVVIIKDILDYYGEEGEDSDFKFAPPPTSAPSSARRIKGEKARPAPPMQVTLQEIDSLTPFPQTESNVDDPGFDI